MHIYIYISPLPWRCSPPLAMASSFLRFLDHIPTNQRSVGLLWTSDQLVAEISTTAYNTHNRQTSIYPAGFEPTILESEWPQTYVLDRAATGIAMYKFIHIFMCVHVHIPTGS